MLQHDFVGFFPLTSLVFHYQALDRFTLVVPGKPISLF